MPEIIFLFIMGAFFFIVGIIGICNNKPSLQNLIILLFPIIGVGLMLVTAANIWNIPTLNFIKENMELIVPLLFLALFFMVGIVLTLVGTIGKIINKTVCTYEVQAQCIDLSSSSGAHTFSPIWQYMHNGKEYTSKSNTRTFMHPPEIGKFYRIFINPAKPEQFYSPEFNGYFIWLFSGILFTFFAIIGFGYGFAEFL